MYNSLLTNNDSIKKLSAVQKLDLQDYVNMREKGLPCMVKWESIKSNWVTNNGVTIWQLSENFLNSSDRAIGLFEPPINLIKWVIEQSKLVA